MIVLLMALAGATDLQLREKGSGEPIGVAVVTVRLDDVPQPDLATDTRGHLQLTLEGTGAHRVTLIPEGWTPVSLDVTLPLPDEPLRLYTARDAGMVIVVEAFQDSPHVSRHHVDAEEALETPGVAEDSFRLVQSLPGVAVQRELSPTAGDLSVRGSAPGDNRAYLDGVEIPYLYHYNQYASVLPTSLVGDIELFSSTFGAQYGDAVGAVVEARSRDDAPRTLHGHVSMNFWMGGASLRAPLGGKWFGAVAGRRSYQDLGGNTSAQFTLWPTFHDYHVRAERIGEHSRTALFAYGAGDAYDRAAGELDLLDPVEQSETASFRYRRSFQVAGAMHRWKTDGDSGRVVAALVADHANGTLSIGGLERLRTTYLSSRLDWSHRLSNKLWADTGWELRAERTGLEVQDVGAVGVLVAEEAPALARGVSVDATVYRVRAAAYSQLSWSPGAWSIDPGVRVGVDTGARAITLSPRLAARWRANDELEFKAAAGRYSQAPETEHLIAGTGDPALPLTHAWQVAAGFDKTFAGRLELSIEAYGKRLENPLLYPVGAPAKAGDLGAAYGIETVIRYRLRETFFLWGWIGLSRSTTHTDAGWRPADGDQPIIGGIVASWDVTDHWNIGVRWRYGSGQPFTTVTGSVYDGGRDSWVPLPGEINGARLPAYMKLDARVAHTWRWDRWSLEVSSEIWWVPKSSAQLYPTWSYDYSEQGWVVGPTFVPLLSGRATF